MELVFGVFGVMWVPWLLIREILVVGMVPLWVISLKRFDWQLPFISFSHLGGKKHAFDNEELSIHRMKIPFICGFWS